jgi:predicted AAA+ superfamily ATPase
MVDTPVIKVLTGIRRSGKSTLLKQLKDYLLESVADEREIVFVNFEDLNYININNATSFVDEIVSTFSSDAKYLFFDEIQFVDGWEKVINGLFTTGKYDIYISGSNSKLLSGDLGTLLSGRYVQMQVSPLTYSEYLRFNKKGSLAKYIKFGGFPGVHINNSSDAFKKNYISDIFDSIILKDTIERYSIRNIDLLKRIIIYVTDNIGSVFSASNVHKYFKSERRTVDIETIYTYLEYLQSSFMIKKVTRYDILGKKQLKIDDKYYLGDHGFLFALFENHRRYISGVIENIVYNELVYRGYDVSIGKLNINEIDFVASRGGSRKWIQVSYLMEDPQTFEREMYPLRKLNTKEDCLILTMDHTRLGNYEGIKVIHLEDWLLGDR